MNRRKFFKGFGLLAAVTTVAPQILNASNKTPKHLYENVNLGANDQEFLIRSSLPLEEWDVLSVDPYYGQQIIVYQELGYCLYSAKLVTNVKEETISSKLFNSNIVWFKIFNMLPLGEFSTLSTSLPIIKEEVYKNGITLELL